jgi:hypothetical protein
MPYPHVNENGKCPYCPHCHPVCGREYRDTRRSMWVMFAIIVMLLIACCYAIAQHPEKPSQGTPHALD